MCGYFSGRFVENCLISKDKADRFKREGVKKEFKSEGLVLTAYYLDGEILVDSIQEVE